MPFNKVNVLVFIALAALAYGLTSYMEQRRPHIVLQPEMASEGFDPGMIVPDFTFTDLRGRTHSVQDFKGKTVILNFWASWCAPCVKEFPLLLRAAHESPEDVVLLALSSDVEQKALERFVHKVEASAKAPVEAENVFIVPDETQALTADLFKIYRLPETILIDSQQVMREKIIGGDWVYEDFKSKLDLLHSSTK